MKVEILQLPSPSHLALWEASALFQGHSGGLQRDPGGEELRPPAKAKQVTILGKDPFVPVKPSGDCSPGQNLSCNLMRDPKPQPLN